MRVKQRQTPRHIQTNHRFRRRIVALMTENEGKEEYYCEVCGRKISKEECEAYDGLCWECWDDQITEECEFEEDII